MKGDDVALQQIKRPFLTNLWVPLLLIVLACLAVAYYGWLFAQARQSSVLANARATGQASSREISGFLAREIERLGAFVEEKQDVIRHIAGDPQDWSSIDALEGSVKRLFRGAFAFAVTDSEARPLFEDFDGLVGAACEQGMRDYLNSMINGDHAFTLPAIHPVPGAYHFDLISPWQQADGTSGLFFLSMAPERIAEIINSAEKTSGMRVLLVKDDDPGLIEVTANGSRDRIDGDIRLTDEQLLSAAFDTLIPGTHWRLLVFPDDAQLAAEVRDIYTKVGMLIVALLLISAALLLAIRRAERRNSSSFMRSMESTLGRQRAILQSMVDGMVMTDASGIIRSVNQATTRLFGYDASDLVGENVRILMPEPDRSRHQGYVQRYLATGEGRMLGPGREVVGRRKDGSVFPVLITLGESVAGDEHMFVAILHDLSARKDAQRMIVSQAMVIERSHQELEEISRMANSQLREPLQRIASLGEALGADELGGLGIHERATIRNLTDEARDASELVKGLADFAHVERAPVDQPVDLDEVIADVQRDLAQNIDRYAVELIVSPLGKVLGNSAHLHQVFWNLIDNALKFHDPLRRIEVEISAEECAEQGQSTGAMVDVRIVDNGIGIPAEEREAVFEAFKRLHPEGSYPGIGLGLAFCRKIVEGVGGQIVIETPREAGCCVKVTLRRPG